MTDEIINRVDESSLMQVDLDSMYPMGGRVTFDLKDQLHEGLVLIEKDLRAFVKENDWSIYADKYVNIVCSADAIVPLWAFMLVASQIKPHAKIVVFGDEESLERAIFTDILNGLDWEEFRDKPVIVKGCGRHNIPQSVFVDFALGLQEVAKSVMFGEACSSVPVYKRR